MRTKDDIAGIEYKRFMQEALKRSDIFSFDIYWLTREHLTKIKENYQKSDKENRDFSYYNDRRIKEFEKDVEIFESKGMTFINSFKPFLLHKQSFRTEDRWFFKASLEALPLLLQPESIYAWRVPYFADNISFIKDGRYWFYTTTHSYDVNFSLDNKEEVKFWENIGIEFFDEFDPNEKKYMLERFYYENASFKNIVKEIKE